MEARFSEPDLGHLVRRIFDMNGPTAEWCERRSKCPPPGGPRFVLAA